ncbi:MAG TPA: Rap1a/Tai family immunity protein [Rhodopila sp.]
MTRSFIALFAAATLAAPFAASAGTFVTGNELIQACSSTKVLDDRQCIGFIAGALDQVAVNPALKGTLCSLPEKTQLKDVKALVVRYGREHADKIGLPAAGLLDAAIKDKYPCS